MSDQQADIVVAGHVCLDVIPVIEERKQPGDSLISPGSLTGVGPAVTATGGPVSNTGLALHRLGVDTSLMGKIGDDLFGHAILELLHEQDEALAEGMIVQPGEASSYSIVISPPGMDRAFLHCSGANDTFGADDVDIEAVAGAQIFHFGYPPLMKRMYADDGAELAALMARVKETGVTTSLDMAYIEPGSAAAQADWEMILQRTLPHVDVYLPSFDETLFMLDRDRFMTLKQQAGEGNMAALADASQLHHLAGQLLEMGVAIAVLKLGDQGLYVRTQAATGRIAAMGRAAPADPPAWTDRELLAPCFKADVVGTTGAGDSTIAGFLAGLLKGLPLAEVMTMAVGVGGFNVESADATSGIPRWETVRERVTAGWDQLPVAIGLPGWEWQTPPGLWRHPD